MKAIFSNLGFRMPTTTNRGLAAFRKTIVALGAFSLCVIGTLYSDPFGARMLSLNGLNKAQDCRALLNQLNNEIRSGKLVYVGSGNATCFTRTAANSLQQGNALMICPTAETNSSVVYFVDPLDQALKRTVNGSAQIEVLAQGITSADAFFAEDYLGHTLAGSQPGRTIRMTLELHQETSNVRRLAPAASSEFCRLQTRVTRRVID